VPRAKTVQNRLKMEHRLKMEMMEKMEKMGQTEMKTTTKIAEVLHLCHHLDRLAAIRQQKWGRRK
jgi:hypothetical protein